MHSFQLLIMHPLQRIKVELRPLFTNHRYEIYSYQIFWMFGKQFGLGDVQTNQSFDIILYYCTHEVLANLAPRGFIYAIYL